MKYLRLSPIILIFLMTVCNDDKVTAPVVMPSDILIGEWNWVSSSGGIAGMTITPASTHYTEQLIFSPDSTYSEFEAAKLINSGNFRVSTNLVATYPPTKTSIVMGGGPQTPYSIKNDTLLFIPGCCDQFVSTYVRMINKKD